MSFATCARPRNAAATRQAILDAASGRFTAESYDQVGMRDVARDVGVDPALISRYFGSKEDLFRAVIDECGDGSDMMDGDRSTFGERVADDLVYGARKDNKLAWLLILLRSASSPKASEIIGQASREGFFNPFTQWLGGDDAPVRARIAAGLMMGMTVGRDVFSGVDDMTPEECEAMKVRLARIVQDLVDA